jgi:Ca2+-binding RTX toxin-like protein
MAIRLGIRDYIRNGDTITFTLVALNADDSVDTSFTGTIQFPTSNTTGLANYTFTAGDAGVRSFTTSAAGPGAVVILAQQQGVGGVNAVLRFADPAGGTITTTSTGDSIYVGGAGADVINSNGAGNDLFFLHSGGSDTANGGAGNDGFYLGNAFDAADIVDGGAGDRDQVAFQGLYNIATVLAANQFTGVEAFALLSVGDTRFGPSFGESNDYNFELTGAWSGITTFNMNGLGESEDAAISAAATTSGAFNFFGGIGREALIGGGQNDGFYFGDSRFNPGVDSVNGLGGADNQIALRGNYTLDFAIASIVNIQTIALISSQDPSYLPIAGPLSYNLTLGDGLVSGANQLTVTGAGLIATETLTVDGSGETSAILRLIGGAGDDMLTGGGGNDILWGGLGGDILAGGGGNNRFLYTGTNQSFAGTPDQLSNFDAGDLIDFSDVDADTVTAGSQDFVFIGSSAFSGAAGEVRAVQIQPNEWVVEVNTGGDAAPEMTLNVQTLGGYSLTAADFILI